MTDTRPPKLRSLTGTGELRRDVALPVPETGSLDGLDPALLAIVDEPRTVEATRMPPAFLLDLTLKTLYFGGMMQGGQVATALRLHFSGVAEPLLRALKAQHLIEVVGGSTLNPVSYQYTITEKGGERARELLERNRYVGPCPVTLEHYVEAVKQQARNRPQVRDADVRTALSGLTFSDEIIERVGPAVNSFESIFVYGPPGNGKTSIARAIGQRLLPGHVMVPYALYEDGQVIKLYDPSVHQPVGSEEAQLNESSRLDKRWVRCRPPIVVTGGELALSDLELSWSESSRFYEAPVQLKANNGLLVVDDFGRQQMSPGQLLNRWIVPLEEKVDYLTFHTGKKFGIPFETLIVFSTNLDPAALVDEAFLRRISHKLGIGDPTEPQFREILVRACAARSFRFEETAYHYLLQEYYFAMNRPLRACHPRDLLKQMIIFANYRGDPPLMTKKLVDQAAHSYFADFF